MKSVGLDDVFVHGMLERRISWPIFNSIHGPKNLRSYSVRFSSITQVGAELKCSGKVTEIFEENDEKFIKVELSATDQNNDVKLMGDAVIALSNIEIMSKEVKDFFTYSDFVKKVTSEPSLDIEALKTSMQEIEDKSPIESARLMTAALGLNPESGEFVEIVKKMFLQGKPPSKDNIFHMKRGAW